MTDTKQEAPELLPCPFCGGRAALTDVRMSGHTFRIGCYNETCGVRPATDYYGSREQPGSAAEVIDAWNARVRADVATGEALDNDGIERILLTVLGECPAAARLRAGEQSRGTSDVRAIIIATLSAGRPTVARPTEEAELVDVSQPHDFVLVKNGDRCGLRGCTLGILEHVAIPSWETLTAAAAGDQGEQ